ncbi:MULTISPECIES: hypothetical protein [unclassified Mesorhizobium]|uniref:VpaChn25_0724 family phage protein n=1 Tax=unclassified Mesorhizobium TaxID=325217 RepID=UPI00333A792C
MTLNIDDYDDYVEQDIRLIILRALAAEDNGTMHEGRLELELKRFGYTKTRAYIRNQLTFLEKTAGAVRNIVGGSVMVATIRKAGRAHIERAQFLEGVKRPSDPD